MNIDPDGKTASDKPAPTITELTSSLRPAPDSSSHSQQPVMETQQEAIMRQLRDSLPNMKLAGKNSREQEFQQILLQQFDKEAQLSDKAKRIPRPTSAVNLYMEELEEYDGRDEDKPIYLSIWRKIYDVTDGLRHYGVDGKYHYLAGHEVGRALATGCFESTGLSYDMRGLSEQQVAEVRGWQEFFGRKYRAVGHLKGKKVDESKPVPSDNCVEADKYEGRPHL